MIPVFLAAAGGWAAGIPARAEVDLPLWDLGEAPIRIALNPEGRRGTFGHTVVRVPPGLAREAGPGAAAFSAQGAPVGLRGYPGPEGGFDYVLALNPREHRAEAYLYLGAEPAEIPAWNPDQSPVLTRSYRVSGKALPTRWEDLAYMMGRDWREPPSWTAPGFGQGANVGPQGDLVFEQIAWMPVSKPGSHRFVLAGAERAFLFVDGTRVLDYRWDGDPRGWKESAPLALAEGLHEVRVVFALSTAGRSLHVGVIPPGDPGGIQSLRGDLLVAGLGLDTFRIERRNRLVHPDFRVEVQPAYRFRNRSVVYSRLVLIDQSRTWADPDPAIRWSVNGLSLAGRQATSILAAEGSAEVILNIEDRLGYRARLDRVIALPASHVQEYAVDGFWVGIPAALYEDDMLSPRVRLQAEVPRELPFRFRYEARGPGGLVMDGQEDLNLAREARTVHLPEVRANRITELHWTLEHAGHPVLSERMVLHDAAHSTESLVPVEDGWEDGSGNRVILVSRRWPEPFAHAGSPHRVLWFDDALAPKNRYTPAGSQAVEHEIRQASRGLDWTRLDVRARSVDGHLPRLAEGRALVERAAARPEATVLISLGLESLLQRIPPSVCEREIATLCDRLAARGVTRQVLVALPPFPGLEDESEAMMRALKTVARPRGIMVIDLYQAFAQVPHRAALFRHGEPLLSASGLERTAAAFSRAWPPGDDGEGAGS